MNATIRAAAALGIEGAASLISRISRRSGGSGGTTPRKPALSAALTVVAVLLFAGFPVSAQILRAPDLWLTSATGAGQAQSATASSAVTAPGERAPLVTHEHPRY